MSDKLLFAELTPRESDAIKGGLTHPDKTTRDYGYKFNEIFVDNYLLSTQQGTALSFDGDANVTNHLTQEVETNIQLKA